MESIFQTIRRNEIDEYYMYIKEVDINIQNIEGQNMLHEAIAYENNIIAKDLINRGINLDFQDEEKKTPLHYCGLYSNFEIAYELIKNKVDIEVLDVHENSPLWTAVFNSMGEYKIVELLVENGANINSKNKANRSPLDFANQIEDKELIKVLTKIR